MKRRVYQTLDSFLEQNAQLKKELPYCDSLEALAMPLCIHGKTLANRLVCQPMEGCDGNVDGTPAELTIRRYQRFAQGGAGLIWFEATACREDGRANPRQLWIRKDNLDHFKKLVDAIREDSIKSNGYAPVILMQATHSGRYSKPHGISEPLIAYQNPILEKNNPIAPERILSDSQLDQIGQDLINAAKLAQDAGFDGVDIKCCHRYINSELLSAFTRPGKYGGSFENRTRLLTETVEGALAVTNNNFIVTTRLNVYDGFAYPYGFGVSPEGGIEFDPREPVQLLRKLQKLGVELVNITMGNPYFNPHVNRPFAIGGYAPQEHPLEGVARMLQGIAMLKQAVPQLKFIASALSYLGIAAPHVCSAFIRDGSFDLCGFGRETFACPDFAKDILNGGLHQDKICLCCSKCSEMMRAGGTPGCVIRDPVYADIYKKFKEASK